MIFLTVVYNVVTQGDEFCWIRIELKKNYKFEEEVGETTKSF